MALTPRNQIQIQNDYPEVLIAVDTVYEIADAELNSDKHVHQLWENLAASHKEFRRTFAREIRHKIEKIAQREGMYVHRHGAECIALRIAQDWTC